MNNQFFSRAFSIWLLVVFFFSSSVAASQVQRWVPAKIVVLKPRPLELPIGGTLRIEVEVFDAQGNRLRGTNVKWQLVRPEDEAFVYLGTVKNDATTNSVELVWRPGTPAAKAPSEVQLIATAGDALTVQSIQYKSDSPVDAVITFEPAQVEVQPGMTATTKVTVRAKEDDRILRDVKITKEELADPEMAKLVKVIGPDKDNTITFIGLFADPAKPKPLLNSVLVVHAAGATKTLPIRYVGEPVKTVWEIIPPEIVGDNFGRTIKQNYIGIEVTIQNYSGSDISLAGLAFERCLNNKIVPKNCSKDQLVLSPASSYGTVRGSLARRKLTHPRALTLAIVDGVGTLMTGFTPFFHNDAHKANFSTFIDIISNPLAKGLASVWKDAYPDELARFDQDILKDDKNIANDATFKTKIFFPKRLLFSDKDSRRNDTAEMRNALGNLIVFGYKFQRGALTNLSSH